MGFWKDALLGRKWGHLQNPVFEKYQFIAVG
jgi:hypothetical protein